jgi:hypothetical protein
VLLFSDPVQQPRRNSLQAMPGAEQMFAKMGPGPAQPAPPTTDMEALYSSPDDLVGFPEPPLPPPEHRVSRAEHNWATYAHDKGSSLE